MKVKCETCNKEFTQPGSLKIHIQRYHKEPGDSSVFYQCDQCGKSFMQNYDLKHHIARNKFEFTQFHEFDTDCKWQGWVYIQLGNERIQQTPLFGVKLF